MDVQAAGLPLPQALYVVYPAVIFEDIWTDKGPHVDYAKIGDIIAKMPEHEQKLIHDMMNGPVVTGNDLK